MKDKALTFWLIIFLCAVIFLLSYVIFLNWHKNEMGALTNQNNELQKKIERLEKLKEATSSAEEDKKE